MDQPGDQQNTRQQGNRDDTVGKGDAAQAAVQRQLSLGDAAEQQHREQQTHTQVVSLRRKVLRDQLPFSHQAAQQKQQRHWQDRLQGISDSFHIPSTSVGQGQSALPTVTSILSS